MNSNVRSYASGAGIARLGPAVLGFALAACTGPNQAPIEPPGPVVATAELEQVKLLSLQWTGGEGATSFRVMRLLDGQPTAVAGDIPGTDSASDLELFLPDQLSAHYQVDACNSAGCVSSPVIDVEREALDAAIGYMKPPSPGSGDRFGAAVAVSADGTVVAVGAPREDGGGAGVNPPVSETLGDSGAVYVYERTGAGVWSEPVYVKAPVPGASDQFGVAVALSADGDVLAVGASGEAGSGTGVGPPHDDNAFGAGAVYVYERSVAGIWGDATYLKAGQVDGGDSFGAALALSEDGDVLVVASVNEDGSGSGVNPVVDESALGAGAVWVYQRSGAGAWLQTAYVKSPHAEAGQFFGFSVALSGDGRVLAVGSTAEDGSGAGVDPTPDEAASDTGAVFVYSKDDNELWSFESYLKASNPDDSDLFGYAVALSADGSVLAAGAPYEDGNGIHVGSTPTESAPDTGAVYVFDRDAELNWSGPQYVKPDGSSPDSLFGFDVGWSGDGTRLAIGAPQEDAGGTGVQPPAAAAIANSGAVWLYERYSQDEWSDGRRLKASNPSVGDAFGYAVAMPTEARLLVVSALLEDGGQGGIGGNQNDNSLSAAGAVYLY